MKGRGDHYRNHVVVGAGSFGTTMAKVLSDAATDRGGRRVVTLCSRRKEQIQEINGRHTNNKYLPNVVLPSSVKASNDIAKSLTHADVIWLALPAQTLRKNLQQWGEHIKRSTVIVSLIKGMDGAYKQRMTQVINQELGHPPEKIAALSGPNLALEIAQQHPAASVIACQDVKVARALAELATSSYFKVDSSDDVIGVEIGGIIKNIIALAIGMCAGKEWGDNTKSLLMTRGFAEMVAFSEVFGARLRTMIGLAGFGDLIATCSSPLSRNYRAGRLIAEGRDVQDLQRIMSQTAEAVASVPAIIEAARRKNLVMPVTEVIHDIIRGEAHADQLGERLMIEAPIAPKKFRKFKKTMNLFRKGVFRRNFKDGILKE